MNVAAQKFDSKELQKLDPAIVSIDDGNNKLQQNDPAIVSIDTS